MQLYTDGTSRKYETYKNTKESNFTNIKNYLIE